jgi:hypothetical protein
MRTLHLLIAAAAAIGIASQASAELVIYKGTLKQTGTGLGVSKKINSQFYLIVDHDTGSIAGIQFATVNGSKTYDAQTQTNLHIVQISGPKGKTIEAIAHTQNDCDISEGNNSDGVFVQGLDSTLTVGAGSTIVFPKVLSGAGTDVSESSGPIYIASLLVVSFDATQTPLSNGNGETLDTAVARISSLLEGQGFQKQSQKIKSSKFPLSLLEN